MTEKMSGLSRSNIVLSLSTGVISYLLITYCLLTTLPGTLPQVYYPLDDTYIYMAMARNIADLGVWGVTPYGFSGTSSAHLWIIVLAIFYKIFGSLEIIPLLLNILFGISCFVVIALGARDFNYSPRQLLVCIFAYLLCVYPSQMTTIGMETVLFSLLSLLFAWCAVKLMHLKDKEKAPKSILIYSALVTALLCACRYESAYVVAPVVLIMLFKRRFLESVILMLSALFPVVAYGAYSMWHHNLFFPNTILLKGRVGFADPMEGIFTQQVDIGKTALKQLWLIGSLSLYLTIRASESIKGRLVYLSTAALLALSTFLGIQHVFKIAEGFGLQSSFARVEDLACQVIFLIASFTAIVAVIHIAKFARQASCQRLLLDVSILAMVTHLFTARFGWLFRYEVYLLSIACLAFIPNLTNYINQNLKDKFTFKNLCGMQNLCFISAIFILSSGIFIRTILSTAVTAIHAKGLRYQHIEAAHFVNKNFGNASVMANDIGALCYYGKKIKILDLWGLADLEVAEARKEHRLDTAFIKEYGERNHADIAVMQDFFWEKTGLPKSWFKAGVWQTPPYNDVGEVSFYAVNHSLEDKLKTTLKEFKLPKQDSLLQN